jgi:fructoselysine-6-P-deglycase FrlB-like protein
VFIAISASGRTPEVIDAGRRHRGSSLVVGVTNDPDSPLATEADVVLPLFAGEERSGVASRTFRATVAVVGLIGDRAVGRAGSPERLRPAAAAVAEAIDGRAAWLDDAVELLDGAPAIDVLGDAADIGTISQAALMLREGPRLPAEAHDAGDWLHTAIYRALPGHRAVLFSGTPYDETLVRTIAGRGGKTVVVGTPVEGAALTIGLPQTTPGDTVARGLVRPVVAELLSAELWRRAAATDL